MKHLFKKIFTNIFGITAIALIALSPTFALADGTITVQALGGDGEATITVTAVGNSTPVSVVIHYGTDATSLSVPSTTVVVPVDSSAVYQITSLQPSTTYYYTVNDAIDQTVVYTTQASFSTNISGQGYGVGIGATAAPTCAAGTDGYCLLAPLGGVSIITDNQLEDYFGMIYKIAIGLAGTLAIIMIFFGGVQYMTTEAIGEKQGAKTRIQNAIIGLILALSSYAILNTVNPNLLDFTFGIDKVTVGFTPGDVAGPLLTVGTGLYTPADVTCTGTGGGAALSSIAQSYIGKVTYVKGEKGSAGPSNTVQYDCSGFVNKVLACAGMPSTSLGTSGIFSGAEVVNGPNDITATQVKGVDLRPGDLLGWTKGGSEGSGHVVIYIGGGKVTESHGNSQVGQATDITTRHILSYKNRIKFIKRTP